MCPQARVSDTQLNVAKLWLLLLKLLDDRMKDESLTGDTWSVVSACLLRRLSGYSQQVLVASREWSRKNRKSQGEM